MSNAWQPAHSNEREPRMPAGVVTAPAAARRCYPSARDTWLMLLMAVFAAGMAVAAAGMIREGLGLAAVLYLVVLAFVLWIVADTRYQLTGAELLVRSGPFRWRIPLVAIETVEASRFPRNLLSSPALSLDRLVVRYRRGARQRWIMVSPRDRAAFLRDLRAAVPSTGIP